MTHTRKLICSTALATLLAGAATAQTLGDTVENAGDVAGEVVEETGEVAGDVVSGTAEAIDEAGDAIAGEGGPVLSADAETIGTVEAVQELEDGQTAILVDLDESLGLDVDKVRVPAEVAADGSFQLAMSRAEFISAVNARIEAQGG